MGNFVSSMIGEKKDWRAMQARAAALPREYRVVYAEVMSYLWKFTAGDGMDVVAVLKQVLALFEAGAAQGQGVLEVTGVDVAAFCDERMAGITPSYVGTWRASLHSDIARKLAV
jgi:DNA-binding ferritin-like protein (Dps family)